MSCKCDYLCKCAAAAAVRQQPLQQQQPQPQKPGGGGRAAQQQQQDVVGGDRAAAHPWRRQHQLIRAGIRPGPARPWDAAQVVSLAGRNLDCTWAEREDPMGNATGIISRIVWLAYKDRLGHHSLFGTERLRNMKTREYKLDVLRLFYGTHYCRDSCPRMTGLSFQCTTHPEGLEPSCGPYPRM